ncbi:soluble starch synthase 1, chloroplastic/amyloplastic-like [Pistacia vera]|uniref:soluble starch synthase 1, chloroplastic/amyloplastic-like n=1 Tax=Pistacia vera TaxID=55513 RepID=UPI0012631924|nr:soluble starch synthase 1, chloroplastic/amyloplastic-like [Pistacia vera]
MECAFVGKFCSTLLVNSRRLKIKRRTEMRSHSKFYSSKFKITSVLSQANHNPSLQVATEKQGSPAGFGLGEWVWPSPGDEIPFWMNKFPSTDVSPEVSADIEKDSNLLHIIHVTAEMAPIAKVGGLGDVVTGLARACLSCGHTVDVMLPFYECIQRQEIK